MKKLLIITTNYSGCECKAPYCNCIQNTGVYLEEFAVPYLVFQKSDIEITVASPKGGLSPVDENSMSCSNPEEWDFCIKVLRETKKLSDINLEEYDGVYFPGGHGPMFDLAENDEARRAVEYFFNSGKLVSAVCHGPAGLINAKKPDGTSILDKKFVTSFTNEEEGIVKLKELVPFLLETRIRELGGNFIAEKPWAEHVEIDGNLITGQNQNSALLIAEKIVEYFNRS